jgi:acetylglutamate kinase
MAQDPQLVATVLSEALPYIQKYDRRLVVVKYGGHAMGDEGAALDFARDVVLLEQMGIKVVVVHGGGPQIDRMLKRLNITSERVDGLRVTDAATMEVAEMVLAGGVNSEIVAAITRAGGKAVGLSGKDARLIFAEKVRRTTRDPDSAIERVVDLGLVGDPVEANTEILEALTRYELDFIPVIAPIAMAKPDPADPQRVAATLNLNADTAAGFIAAKMGAARLLLMTDVDGVKGADGNVILEMSTAEARGLIASGVANGGMVPKLETAIAAREGGVEGVVILNGSTPHALLMELFTEHGSGGTLVV